MSTNIRQVHSGDGDNITGNKYVINNQPNYFTTLREDIDSRIGSYKNHQVFDFNDGDVLDVFRDKIFDLIQEQQEKCHGIVPINAVRNILKDIINDDIFERLIRELHSSKQVNIDEAQVCYIPKKLDYKIQL